MDLAAIDQDKFHALISKVGADASGAVGVILARVGDRLGLYSALADHGPLTSQELADKTGTTERYVREWLSSNAAGGYIEYDPATTTFSMTPEQQLVFAGEGMLGCMQGFFDAVYSVYADSDKNIEAFKTGEGIPWSARCPCCFKGTERFFRPNYAAMLVDAWIPALSGVQEKLEAGANVADVGCGCGASSILMAQAFPNSTFYGFDYHVPSIETAQERAREAGVEGNTVFEVAGADNFANKGYDLVAVFDAIHDMGDPVGVTRYIRSTLNDGGTFMMVEPMAADNLEDNFHPQGQAFYGMSTMICTAVSLSQPVGLALGAQAGEKRLTEVLKQGGFTNVRRAAETPNNMVLEATG